MDVALSLSAFPAVPPEALTGGAPIVILAPHPDDESLGCGILLAHAFGHAGALVVCMTDGAASHAAQGGWTGRRLSDLRRAELARAVGHLGGAPEDVAWLGHPDGWLGARDRDAVARQVADLCRARGARTLFATSPDDHHEDHRSTADIARRAVALLPGVALYSYPIWSRWDDPDLSTRIAARHPVRLPPGPHGAVKRAAIAAHGSQLGTVGAGGPGGAILPKGFVESFAATPELYWRDPEAGAQR